MYVIRTVGKMKRRSCLPKNHFLKRKMSSLAGLKKAPDLHLNQRIDLKVSDMYFLFKTRIAGIYVIFL